MSVQWKQEDAIMTEPSLEGQVSTRDEHDVTNYPRHLQTTTALSSCSALVAGEANDSLSEKQNTYNQKSSPNLLQMDNCSKCAHSDATQLNITDQRVHVYRGNRVMSRGMLSEPDRETGGGNGRGDGEDERVSVMATSDDLSAPANESIDLLQTIVVRRPRSSFRRLRDASSPRHHFLSALCSCNCEPQRLHKGSYRLTAGAAHRCLPLVEEDQNETSGTDRNVAQSDRGLEFELLQNSQMLGPNVVTSRDEKFCVTTSCAACHDEEAAAAADAAKTATATNTSDFSSIYRDDKKMKSGCRPLQRIRLKPPSCNEAHTSSRNHMDKTFMKLRNSADFQCNCLLAEPCKSSPSHHCHCNPDVASKNDTNDSDDSDPCEDYDTDDITVYSPKFTPNRRTSSIDTPSSALRRPSIEVGEDPEVEFFNDERRTPRFGQHCQYCGAGLFSLRRVLMCAMENCCCLRRRPPLMDSFEGKVFVGSCSRTRKQVRPQRLLSNERTNFETRGTRNNSTSFCSTGNDVASTHTISGSGLSEVLIMCQTGDDNSCSDGLLRHQNEWGEAMKANSSLTSGFVCRDDDGHDLATSSASRVFERTWNLRHKSRKLDTDSVDDVRTGRLLRKCVVYACVVSCVLLAVIVGTGVSVFLLNTNHSNNSSLETGSGAAVLAGEVQYSAAAGLPMFNVRAPTAGRQHVTIVPSTYSLHPDVSGWVFYSRGSVNGSHYKVLHKAMTYDAAQEYCQSLGGYLARINTIREQVFIEEFLQQELQTTGNNATPGGVGFWIGARRARGSHGDTCMFDQWKWMDSYGRAHGTISGFTAFIPGKPDNYYSPEECLFISYRDEDKSDRYLKWDDAPCDINSLGGIKVLCEMEST